MKKTLVALCIPAVIVGCASTKEPPTSRLENVPVVSATLQDQERGLKRVVAIARFSNETRTASSFLIDDNNDRIGKQAMDILSTRLAATNRFIMLERADLDKVVAEGNLASVQTMNIPSDFLIVGSVSEFGRRNESDVGVFSRSRRQIASATVNIRLIDTSTGQIVYSEEASGEATTEAGSVMGYGGRAGYDSSLDDAAISAAISKMVSNVVENLLDRPWRSFLISKQGDNFIMAGGASQGIRVGDTFRVVKNGESVLNPQTGLTIELPGEEVGTIQVLSLSGRGDSEIAIVRYQGQQIGEQLHDYHIAEL